jgi:hypothetical protein
VHLVGDRGEGYVAEAWPGDVDILMLQEGIW